MEIKLASWNVNGIRAVSAKEEWQQWFAQDKYDVIGFQETKAEKSQIPEHIVNKEGYQSYFASSVVKKGYSGTAVFSKIEPKSVEIELPDPAFQGEGRIVHLEFEKFHFFNGYFPNGGAEVLDENGKPIKGQFKRVPYKMGFFDSFFKYAQELRKSKPIVVCGDFNIAHNEIDLARPKTNKNTTGFLQIERDFLDMFTQAGYIDTFRHVHGNEEGHYSWWSYKMQARAKNVGWRIDYFFVSDELKDNIKDATIEKDVFGSDHCPVTLTLDIQQQLLWKKRSVGKPQSAFFFCALVLTLIKAENIQLAISQKSRQHYCRCIQIMFNGRCCAQGRPLPLFCHVRVVGFGLTNQQLAMRHALCAMAITIGQSQEQCIKGNELCACAMGYSHWTWLKTFMP